jgi:hypothetical protein
LLLVQNHPLAVKVGNAKMDSKHILKKALFHYSGWMLCSFIKAILATNFHGNLNAIATLKPKKKTL